MKGKMKEKMKRDKDERKEDFFVKNVSEPSNPPDELITPKCFEKIPFGRIILSFFFEGSESDRFSIICVIRIRFFGSGELIRERSGLHGIA